MLTRNKIAAAIAALLAAFTLMFGFGVSHPTPAQAGTVSSLTNATNTVYLGWKKVGTAYSGATLPPRTTYNFVTSSVSWHTGPHWRCGWYYKSDGRYHENYGGNYGYWQIVSQDTVVTGCSPY